MTEKATFAGGCFWCMVKPFDQFEGIEKVVSGYTGGHVKNPSYEQVKTGTTGHLEVVEITFDPEVFSFEQLLDIYWQQIDPTDNEGQFQDRGDQYKPAIFIHNDRQRGIAEKSKQALDASGRYKKPVNTQFLTLNRFTKQNNTTRITTKKIRIITQKTAQSPAGISFLLLPGSRKKSVNKF